MKTPNELAAMVALGEIAGFRVFRDGGKPTVVIEIFQREDGQTLYEAIAATNDQLDHKGVEHATKLMGAIADKVLSSYCDTPIVPGLAVTITEDVALSIGMFIGERRMKTGFIPKVELDDQNRLILTWWVE